MEISLAQHNEISIMRKACRSEVMSTATFSLSDCYSFLKDSGPEADARAQMAVEDLAKALDTAAIGFLDSEILERATLAGYLDGTPPEEINPEALTRACNFCSSLVERVLLHPRVRLCEGVGRELEFLREKTEEVISRDIAAYNVSYASLEARQLVPFLREYKASMETLSTGISQLRQARHIPIHRSLYTALLHFAPLVNQVSGLEEATLGDYNLLCACLYEVLVRAAEDPNRPFTITLLSSDARLLQLLAFGTRLLWDPEFTGQPHRLGPLFSRVGADSSGGGRILVYGYHPQAQRFRPAFSSAVPAPENHAQFLHRLQGGTPRELGLRLLREAVQAILSEHLSAFPATVGLPNVTEAAEPQLSESLSEAAQLREPLQRENPPLPANAAQQPPILSVQETSLSEAMKPPSESRSDMQTAEEIQPAQPKPAEEAPAPGAPTLDQLPATDDLAAQTLRKLYARSRATLAQVREDVNKLGDKLLTDEGAKRIAERIGDEAFAQALATEVASTKQVIEGKLAILQTQKTELLQKKAALNSEIEALRGSVVVVANAVEREMELLRRDAELGSELSKVLNKLRDFSPLVDSLQRIGSSGAAVPSAEGTFRLSQIVEELGTQAHNVSALVKQLRDKGILPPQQQRGVYTAQERQIILDLWHSKSVSELSREWGNAVSTLKQAIIERLIEGRDYYNLGKGGERDSFRVTPLGQDKLRKALTLTRARTH